MKKTLSFLSFLIVFSTLVIDASSKNTETSSNNIKTLSKETIKIEWSDW